MLTAKLLKKLVSGYINKPMVFPSHIPPAIKKIMEQESAFSYKHLQSIAGWMAEGSSDKAKHSIRVFLKERWLFIKKTGWAYPRYPFLPINQLCLQIAEQIAGEDEAICQVLMPGIKQIGRIPASTGSLKKETEDNGHFPVHNYILAKKEGMLLPIESIYIDAVADTNCLFSDFQDNSLKLRYSVQSEDLWNIRQAAGESSNRLMDKLFQVHKQQHDNGSLGFAIKNLAQHILERSNLDAGIIDTIAEVKLELVTEPIREFYAIWRALPKEIKNELFLMREGGCQSPGYPLPLYFFRLFASVPDCPLEEEEWAALQKSQLTECAVRIAHTLNKFLSDYGLDDNCVLGTSQRESKAQIKNSLLDLLENTLNAIKRRGPVFEIETPLILSELITFMRAVGTSVDKIAEFASPCVYSFQDLATLTMIPDLLDAAIPHISPRADGFEKTNPIYLAALTEDQQKKFITERLLKKMSTEIETRLSFHNVGYPLKPALRDRLNKILIAKLKDEVHCLADLKAIAQRFSGGGPILGLLRALKNDLDQYFDNDIEEALSFYAELRYNCQRFLNNWLLKFCYQKITPDNFETHFLRIPNIVMSGLLVKWSENTGSFADYLKLLDKWSRCPRLLPELNASNKKKLRAWVTSETLLEQLIQKMPASDKGATILWFRERISSRVFLYRYWSFIPENLQTDFLLAVNLKLIITNVDELKLVLALLDTKGKKARILAQFQPADLKCTPEYLAKLQKSFAVDNQDIIDEITSLKSRCQNRDNYPWGLTELDTLKRNLIESDSRDASFILVWRLHAWISQAHMNYQFDPLIYRVLSRIISQESTRISYGLERSGSSLNGKAQAIAELKQALNGSYITPFPNYNRYRLNNLLKSIDTETSPRQLLRLLETAEQDLDYVKSSRVLKFIKKSEIEFIETEIIMFTQKIYTTTGDRDFLNKLVLLYNKYGHVAVESPPANYPQDNKGLIPLPYVSNRHIHTANTLLRAIEKEKSDLYPLLERLFKQLYLIKADLAKSCDINHEKQCLAEQIRSKRALTKALIEPKRIKTPKNMETTITATQIEEKVYEEMKMLGLKQLLRNYPSKKPYRPEPSETMITTSNTLQLTANSATIAKDDKLHLECLFSTQEEEAQSLFANSYQSFFKRKQLNITKTRGSTAVIKHLNKKSM